MAARLKVYRAAIDGLNDWIVAAPNQKAALEAFGVNQNLFQLGSASTTDEDAAVAAALARPGEALKRPTGSKSPFKPVAEADASGWEAAAKAVGAKKPKTRPPASPAEKPKPDRSNLNAAEQALRAFESEARERMADLERRRREAEDAERFERQALSARRRELQAALDKETAAYQHSR